MWRILFPLLNRNKIRAAPGQWLASNILTSTPSITCVKPICKGHIHLHHTRVSNLKWSVKPTRQSTSYLHFLTEWRWLLAFGKINSSTTIIPWIDVEAKDTQTCSDRCAIDGSVTPGLRQPSIVIIVKMCEEVSRTALHFAIFEGIHSERSSCKAYNFIGFREVWNPQNICSCPRYVWWFLWEPPNAVSVHWQERFQDLEIRESHGSCFWIGISSWLKKKIEKKKTRRVWSSTSKTLDTNPLPGILL